METVLFVLPSLLVAMAYLAPVPNMKSQTAEVSVFGSICGCGR